MTPHPQLVAKLNRISAKKHFDAYADIAWDAPENGIDPRDPRWELGDEQPLGASQWYRALPAATRARLGLHFVASAMRVGVEFERVLKLGLLELVGALPPGAPEQRYAYHELIEEAQHALMFNEFLRRAQLAADLEIRSLPARLEPIRARIPGSARWFPELFFVFVLGGEDPIDHAQRVALAARRELHPLLRRIISIHVTEEARHVAFARSYLAEHVPRLSAARKRALVLLAPVVLGIMARMILTPRRHLQREYGIPPELVTRDPRQRAHIVDSVRKVRDVLADLELVEPALWRRCGVA